MGGESTNNRTKRYMQNHHSFPLTFYIDLRPSYFINFSLLKNDERKIMNKFVWVAFLSFHSMNTQAASLNKDEALKPPSAFKPLSPRASSARELFASYSSPSLPDHNPKRKKSNPSITTAVIPEEYNPKRKKFDSGINQPSNSRQLTIPIFSANVSASFQDNERYVDPNGYSWIIFKGLPYLEVEGGIYHINGQIYLLIGGKMQPGCIFSPCEPQPQLYRSVNHPSTFTPQLQPLYAPMMMPPHLNQLYPYGGGMLPPSILPPYLQASSLSMMAPQPNHFQSYGKSGLGLNTFIPQPAFPLAPQPPLQDRLNILSQRHTTEENNPPPSAQ